MQQSSATLKNPVDGFEFYTQTWKAGKTKPEKVIVVQHGFGEHSGRYQNLIAALEDEKASVYALDARGHGKTPGKRGHISDFNLYASDLAVLVQKARAENKGVPIFLLGHSMGALIATLAALKSEVAAELSGLILSSGAFKPALDTVQAIKKAVGTVLARFAPALTVPAGLNVNLISRDHAVVQAYINDPLVHGMISLKMGVDLFAVGEALIEQASRITLPVLVFHGDADGIAQAQGSKEFFQALSSKDKTLKIYPGFYHETMNEPLADRKQVLNDVVQWINKHV
jgi:lysophospholipase